MDIMTDKRNPSLKKYFKYMVNSRKLTIKFTPNKIKQIIIMDLQIDFTKFSELLKDVSVEMFTFYIQTWPGWQPDQFQQCIDRPEISYSNFKEYLKDKILSLNEKQHLYNGAEDTVLMVDESIKYQLNPPLNSYQLLPADNSKRKIKFPYTLQIITNPQQFNSIYFQSLNGRTTVSVQEQPAILSRVLSTIEALNHPYVSILFKLPDLIKFSRKNVHRVEMFLCRLTDNWQYPNQDHIIDIRKYPSRTGVYTSGFLHMLFNNINSIVEKHAQKIKKVTSQDIKIILNEFLLDVIESDLNYSSIQECTEICFSIGGSSYFSDSKHKSGPINFRKIYQPQVLYSLIFCGVMGLDISEDGISYFKNLEENGDANENIKKFLSDIDNSIHLSCTMCNTHYTDMTLLKQHLLQVHYNSDILVCTRCKQEGHLHEIIECRWAHNCVNNPKNITTTSTTSPNE